MTPLRNIMTDNEDTVKLTLPVSERDKVSPRVMASKTVLLQLERYLKKKNIRLAILHMDMNAARVNLLFKY